MTNDFYDAGAARRVANTLFLGWGYNFYRRENQLRADDQLVRHRASGLLGQAAASVKDAEADYRRSSIAPPTRANPFPDPAAMAGAQGLERLGQEIVALVGRLHALPAPEQDLMTLRVRQEADTLERLIAVDEQIVGRAELIRVAVQDRDAAWLLTNLADLQAALAGLRESLREREAVLA